MRLLVVEDDADMAAALAQGFREEGFAVDVAGDGLSGLHAAETEEHDALILDVMLPGLNGFDLARRLREEGNPVPVIFLTARASVQDRVEGLKLGGDDYLPKPFSFEELLARVRVALRRATGAATDRLEWGELTFDPAAHRAQWRGEEVRLTQKELSILEALLLSRGKVLSRSRLIQKVYDASFEGDPSVLDVHLANLRRKLRECTGSSIIENVRGVGFRIPGRPP